MTDIEIPDNEEAACYLDGASIRAHAREEPAWARAFSGAARRLRADAEKIKRLEALVAELDDRQVRVRDADATGWLRREIENHNTSRESAYVSCRLSDLRRVLAHIDRIESELNDALCEAAAQRELATLLELESPDPLTRIAAALERPSREWVAALILAARAAGEAPWNREIHIAKTGADALLAEMGEG